jgi:hypothetical protein
MGLRKGNRKPEELTPLPTNANRTVPAILLRVP